jgi:hypothetical protein
MGEFGWLQVVSSAVVGESWRTTGSDPMDQTFHGISIYYPAVESLVQERGGYPVENAGIINSLVS